MKVLALGGCGGMGQYAVETAHQFDSIEKITVADLNLANATEFASRFDDRVDAAQIDITDEARLKALLSDYDVVLSTVGPYYLFGTMVLKAAIATKTHYIDICDDWEPTLEMFELNQAAEKAGITAIVGAGASPGISNLLAAKAISELERVDEVYTTWGGGGTLKDSEGDLEISTPEGKPTAATIHWLQQLTGNIMDWQHGSATVSKPLMKEVINYPGVGKVACHSVGHPEPLTLPRYFPQIRRSKNLMNMPGYIIYVLKKAAELYDHKGATIQEAAQCVIDKLEDEDSVSMTDSANYLLHEFRDASRRFMPALTAVAIGRRNGRPMTVSAHFEGTVLDGQMGATTSVPSAVILNMLAKGEIRKRGVLAPEGCVDPDSFFGYLSKFVHFHGGFDQDNYLVIRHQ